MFYFELIIRAVFFVVGLLLFVVGFLQWFLPRKTPDAYDIMERRGVRAVALGAALIYAAMKMF